MFKKLSKLHGYCKKTGKKIVINTDESLLRSLSTLAHELRHSWQILEAGHPIRPHIDNENLFAASILVRFMEADASSFESFFVLAYLHSVPSSETVFELLKSETEIFHRLDAIKQQTGDNPAHEAIRKTAFEIFFQSPYKDAYDQRMTVKRPIVTGWLKTKTMKCFLKYRLPMIKEESLIAMGKSAWGECKGRNFLETDGKPFDITDDKYTGTFSSEALNHLREISSLPYYQGMNRIQLKNGQKRPLIQLGE